MSKLRKHDYTMDGSDWDLSLLSLKEAPVDELKKNPKARKIDLSNNSLTRLPPTFTSLTHLIELDLSKNQLQELPESFGQLSKLVRLDLYDNQLKSLPLSFGQLSKLKWLDLKGNSLDTPLARYAGDCADARQCQSCAVNVIKFMKFEKLRVESELRLKAEKLRQKHEFEKQLEEKSKKEREKKKAKKARSSARRAQQVVDDKTDNAEEDTDSSELNETTVPESGRNSLISIILWLIRFLFCVSFVLFIGFIGIAIGLHLQNGHKLQTFDDIVTAVSDSLKKVQNYKQFTEETTTLFTNIIKALRDWKKTFNVFDNKLNVNKN